MCIELPSSEWRGGGRKKDKVSMGLYPMVSGGRKRDRQTGRQTERDTHTQKIEWGEQRSVQKKKSD